MADQTTTIPKGWKMTTLGEVADIIMGQSPSGESYNQKNDGLPFYQGITEFGDKYVNIKTFTNAPTKIIEANSILFSVRAPVGKVNFTKHKACIGRGNAGLKMKNGQQNFLYFLLKKSEKVFLSNTTGTVFDSISGGQLREFEVLIPEREEEQCAIAAVLSSLDDKIELLREQNKTLEATAQAIFKEWFVNFNFPGRAVEMIDSELGKIPEEWKVGRVRDVVAENTRGIAPAYSESGIPVINQRCVRNGTIIEEAIQYHDNSAKQAPAWAYLKPNDILINSMGVGTLGRISQVFLKREKDYLVHSCITILRANEEIIDPIILGYYFKSIESKIESMGTGTTGQTSLNNSLLGELKLVIPDKKNQEKLSPTFKNIVLKIDSNYLEIQTLSSIRDLLLPKLMKGEVRVAGFND